MLACAAAASASRRAFWAAASSELIRCPSSANTVAPFLKQLGAQLCKPSLEASIAGRTDASLGIFALALLRREARAEFGGPLLLNTKRAARLVAFSLILGGAIDLLSGGCRARLTASGKQWMRRVGGRAGQFKAVELMKRPSPRRAPSGQKPLLHAHLCLIERRLECLDLRP
eukprot:scaffold78070_cov23-Tisochrysis_lutea.AAC.1